jgi:hypothetical protein
MITGGHISVQTSATGANFATFAAQRAKQLTLVNDTGTPVEFGTNSDTVYLPVADGDRYTIFGIENAIEVKVRRVDQSNTQVTVKARWEY